MQRTVFGAKPVDAYHRDLLIVRVQRGTPGHAAARALSAAMAADARALPAVVAAGTVLESLGFQALEAFQRAGRIRRVTPLARRSVARGAAVVARSIQGATTLSLFESLIDEAASPTIGERIEDGVSIIEVEEGGHDVDELKAALAQDPSVVSVSRVPVRYLCAKPRRAMVVPPGTPGAMWNLQKIHWAQARGKASFVDADEIKVAVLDTGIEERHPDLAGRVARYEWFSNLPGVVTSADDIVGHGTHVAGTIAADIQNGIGIAGVCRAQIHAWKIFDDVPVFVGNEFAYVVNPVMYLRALLDCLDEGVDVVNLSIGGSGMPTPQEQQAVNALLAQDVAVVAAMGNEREYGSPVSYPAAIPDVIAVGATRADDRVANFSNRGTHIALCAPGVAIWSTLPTYRGQTGFDVAIGPSGPIQGKPQRRETDYDAWDGTSMATPHVSAAVALLMAKDRGAGGGARATLSSIRQVLLASCDPTPAMASAHPHPDYGAGRLNLERLL